MKEHRYWVYIMVSRSLSTMYIGVTNDLGRRVLEHRTGKGSEFAQKYRVTKLVYAKEYELIEEAIAREKQLKGWKRIRKNELVRATNPDWNDLMPTVGNRHEVPRFAQDDKEGPDRGEHRAPSGRARRDAVAGRRQGRIGGHA